MAVTIPSTLLVSLALPTDLHLLSIICYKSTISTCTFVMIDGPALYYEIKRAPIHEEHDLMMEKRENQKHITSQNSSIAGIEIHAKF